MALVSNGVQRRLIVVSLTSSKLRSVSCGTSGWMGRDLGAEKEREKKTQKRQTKKQRAKREEKEKGEKGYKLVNLGHKHWTSSRVTLMEALMLSLRLLIYRYIYHQMVVYLCYHLVIYKVNIKSISVTYESL